MKKDNTNKIVVCAFGLFFVFLLLQYCNVFVQFDDFGYATLAYATPNNNCYEFSFPLLLKFLWNHYNGWGGRIAYTFIEILLLKLPDWCIRVFFSIIVCLVYFLLYKMISQDIQCKTKIFWTVFILLSYGMFSLEYVRGSFYWYSAAMTYIVPIVLIYYLAMKLVDCEYDIYSKKMKLFMGCIIFCAAISHEMISLIVCLIVVLAVLFRRKSIKNLKKIDYIYVSISLFGFFLVFLAPGNFKRLQLTESDGQIIKSVVVNINNIFNYLFAVSNRRYMSILLLSFTCLGITLIREKRKIIGVIQTIYSILLFMWMFMFDLGIYRQGSFLCVGGVSFGIILGYIGVTIFSLCIYYKEKEKRNFVLLIAGGGSLSFFVISSSISERIFVPFMLCSMPFIITMFVRMKGKTSQVVIVLAVIWGMMCTTNLIGIYSAYQKNSIYQEYNDRVLRVSSAKIASGETIDYVKLEKLPSKGAYVNMPYEYDNGITIWMHYYYNIPQNVLFVWD